MQPLLNKLSNRYLGVVHVPAQGVSREGRVLLSYLTGPFTRLPWQRFTDPHTNYWECAEIARLFAVRGYNVDIIDASNITFVPNKAYDIVVDVRQNLERLAGRLPTSCKKVMHITSSESSFQNAAEARRLTDLMKRRGTCLLAQRVESGLNNPAHADFLEGFGNTTVHATFSRFNKPIHRIPISVAQMFDFPDHSMKDFSSARKHFLFFSGGGAILKGLDLLLEAFMKMPEFHLHIIGPAANEVEFSKVYARELSLPNIHRYPRPRITMNRGVEKMMVGEKKFMDIANRCAAIIYPSASEGTSGAVIQAMHAGIFPIVTKQTGLDEGAPAIILTSGTSDMLVEDIQKQVYGIAAMAPETLEAMARSAWSYVRAHHTKETFTASYAHFIDTILLK